MADQFIGLDEPGTIDKKVDGEELVVGANTVIRERIQVAGAAAAAIAAVLNSAPSTEYGVVVRQAGALPAGTNNVGDVDVATFPPDATASGSLTAAGQAVTYDLNNGYTAVGVQVTGTWTGQLEFEVTIDDTNWVSHDFINNATDQITNSTTVNGVFFAGVASFSQVRVRASALSSGTAVVSLKVSVGTESVHLESPLPAGMNSIGTVVTNVERNEDDPHTTGDKGVFVLGVRNTNYAALTNTDLDYSPIGVASNGSVLVDVGKSEDALHVSGERGAFVLGVRNDAGATTLTTGDGDYSPLATDSVGRVGIADLNGSITVDATDLDIRNLVAATDIVDLGGNALTSLQLTDDIVYATNGALNKAAAIAGQLDDTGTTAATENNVAPVRITAQRALHANLRNDAGTEIGTSGAPVRTDPTGTTTQPVSGTVTASQATASSLNAEVQGDAAHDATVSGNPVLVGGYSETPGDSVPGNQVTAEGEATRLAVDRDGALYTHPHPPRIWHTTNKYTTQQTDTSIKAAEASVSHYITDIVIMCNAAVTVTIEEGTATARFEYYASGQGDGVAHAFAVPIKLAANTAITVTTSAAVTVFIVVNGYTAP